jgi:hypothetical protein
LESLGKFWKIYFWSTRLWKSYGFFVACLAYTLQYA